MNGPSFRDRRYEYKKLNKIWKGKLSEAKASGNSIKIVEAQVLICSPCQDFATLSEFQFPTTNICWLCLLMHSGHGSSL